MNDHEELLKWNNLFSKNKLFKNKLKKIKDVNLLNYGFYNDLEVADNCIYGKYDIGYSNVNAISLKKIIDIFIKIIDTDNKKNDYIAITSDGDKNCSEIIESLVKINDKNLKFITFLNNYGFDKKFIISSASKINPLCWIHLSKSIFDNDIININLYNSEGLKIGNKILEGILKKIKKNSLDINIIDRNNLSFFNNELLIKIFVDKLNVLFDRKNKLKKTKIAISNRSEGITNIIAKLIGIHDFSYVVNNKIKKKNICLFNRKHLSDSKIKKIFWKDILFAIRKKANLLICFNPEGTQLFLFIIEGTSIKYLNSNLLSLIFLNHFYNDLQINIKKVPSFYIASNNNAEDSILKLIKKYSINFKKNAKNEFLSKDYLLLFWNNYNQFVFGEKINQEFSIYHFLIKMLNIINYYYNQYGSINSLLNSLNKMYGKFELEDRYILDIKLDTINKKLQNIFKNISQDKQESKIINYVNEETIREIDMDDEIKINIKYNFIINKIIIIFNHKKNTNIIDELKIKTKIKMIIKNISKK